MTRSFSAIVLIIQLSISFVSVPSEAREEPARDRDNDGVTSNERRRTISFGNWTLELLYGARRDHSERRQPQHYIETNRIVDVAKPNQILTAAITPGTSSRHAAALRFAEKGRKLLQAGESEPALLTLEKSLSLASIPYTYYYLARAHHDLSNYQESVTFLDVAASRLDTSPDWMAAVLALKKQNERALTKQSQERQASRAREEQAVQQRADHVRNLSLVISLALAVFLSFLILTMLWSVRLVKSAS